MAAANLDFRELRGATIMLVVALAIGGGLLYWGLQYAQTTETEFRKGQSRFKSAKRRYSTLDDQQREIEQYLPQYQALEEAGIIGDESRLNWIETLRGLAVNMKLPVMRYEISSQDELEPDFEFPSGNFKVFATEMRLTAGLLHEADLPMMVNALTEAANGLFTVSGCSIARRSRAFAGKPDPRKPNLDVECVLRWYVVRKPEPRA
ncbi:MAG: hypothetical protein AAF458_15925 [Pseudomonadota bacterium]